MLTPFGNCLGRNLGDFPQEARQPCPQSVSTHHDFRQSFELSQCYGALEFGHLVIGRQEERVANPFFPLKTLVQVERGKIAKAVIIGENHSTGSTSNMLEVV